MHSNFPPIDYTVRLLGNIYYLLYASPVSDEWKGRDPIVAFGTFYLH